jgi:cytosine/adenosine deaminase-related metal-dependent hydrolase
MDRPIIGDGAVVIDRGRVASAGEAVKVARDFPTAEHHDLGGSVLTPGLINAHAHLELCDTPRPGERWEGSFADWLIEVIKTAPPDGDAARVRRAVATGVEQCLRFGVTTVGDITRQPRLTRPLLRDAPLRVVSFGEVQGMARRRNVFEPRLAAAADRTHEGGRLRVGVSPHAPYSVERWGYQRCVDLARASGLPLSTHLAESADERPFLADHSGPLRRIWDFLQAWGDDVPRFAGGPVRLAHAVGLLDVPAVLAHVNYCDDDELELLARGRASVAYCPRTHAYFGHAPHRWRDMLAAGVNVALGTDSLASSPDLNVLDDLRVLRRLAPDIPAADVWPLVTTRAAQALGMTAHVGSLTPGKKADITCFPDPGTDRPLDALLHEPVLPTRVWIGGEIVFPPAG